MKLEPGIDLLVRTLSFCLDTLIFLVSLLSQMNDDISSRSLMFFTVKYYNWATMYFIDFHFLLPKSNPHFSLTVKFVERNFLLS